jgi:large subunit ribosomal protein L18
MSSIKKNLARFARRRNRSKKVIESGSGVPRLCVYRSNKGIEAQIIDDGKGITLVSSSSLRKEMQAEIKKAESKIEVSVIVGKDLAKQALKLKIKKVVFDRNGYPYHGRIKALADAAREGGLNF